MKNGWMDRQTEVRMMGGWTDTQTSSVKPICPHHYRVVGYKKECHLLHRLLGPFSIHCLKHSMLSENFSRQHFEIVFLLKQWAWCMCKGQTGGQHRLLGPFSIHCLKHSMLSENFSRQHFEIVFLLKQWAWCMCKGQTGGQHRLIRAFIFS